jgi:hypothetical protein
MTEDLTLEQIGKHMRIEIESRIRDDIQFESNVNVNNVHNRGSRTKNYLKVNKKGTSFKKNNYKDPNKDKKYRSCFNCGKNGHYIRECIFLKSKKKENGRSSNIANTIEEIIAMVTDMQIGMIIEVHIAMATNSIDWWFDSSATVHVCNEKVQFKNYVTSTDSEEVLMENHNSSKGHGKWTVEMQFTSRKKLILTNVLHVLEIKMNLVSASLLCKRGIKVVIEFDNLIFSKNGMFIGNGYSCNGLFKLSIINKAISNSSYIVESSSLWHGRLAHLNFKYLKYMSKHGLISYKHDNNEICEICIQVKMTKKPFPTVRRNSQILELIHYDTCELNGILTRGGSKVFYYICR